MSIKIATVLLAALASATPLDTPNPSSNEEPCEPCQPQGATGTNPPSIGPGLSSLYTNVLSSVAHLKFDQKRSLPTRASNFCCRASLDCINLQSLNIPMCYDKFTTNFQFADNSYGSLTTGEYTSNGQSANLLTGNYASGNIYASDPQAKPNTATLSIPPQFTGTGVGGPVPPGQLGSVLVYTTTIAGATYTQPTILSESVRVEVVSGSAVTRTIAPQTITQATVLPERTVIVTTIRQDGVSAGESSTPAALSTGAAGRAGVEGGVGLLGVMVGALAVM